MASRVGLLLALGAFGLNEVKAAAAALSHRSFGTGHSLKDVLIAASEDDADAEEKPLTKHQDFSRLEDIADANDAVDAQEMSRKVADLEAKLQTMKKMAMLQTAETKATMTSLEERLSTAEEQAAESQGELEVSEAHAKDLEQQLIKEMARRRKAEEQLHPEPFSFLQLSASEAEEIAEMKKELADVKSKISKERREGQLTQEKLMASSRQVEATQKKLKKLQEAKKRHPGKAAKKTPVVAMGKKVGAARQELAQLKVQRQELRKQLRDQQEALDHVNLDVKRYSEHVKQLKSRSHDLQEMMKNMQLADKKQLKQATAESHRIQKMFASVDQELQKARAKKAQLDAKVAQVAYERKKEEQRAKNEESEAKTIGAEVDQAENELHQVKQEITKLNVEIFQEQQKAQAAEKTMREEQQKYQEELKTKQLREEQVQKMMALLTTKDEAMTSLEGRFSKLQRKAKAAQQLLDKEEKKAELQEQAAQKQLENERKQAEKIEKEETLKLQKVKQQLEEEAEKARKAFDDQVQLMRKRNDKEVQEEKHKIEQKVTLEQHQIMEKVSNEKVNKAKMKLQKLQEEVIGEEEALGTKKLELQRVLREAKDMESRAKTQEAAESQEENLLEAKLKAASVMEHKGKTALQRQAEHQAAELQKLIVQQKEMEQKQVSALEKQIKATQAKSPKFLSA